MDQTLSADAHAKINKDICPDCGHVHEGVTWETGEDTKDGLCTFLCRSEKCKAHFVVLGPNAWGRVVAAAPAAAS